MSRIRNLLSGKLDHVRDKLTSKTRQQYQYQSDQIKTEKPWLDLRYHDESKTLIKKPEDLENEMQEPPAGVVDENILDRITGSMVGMALGDALGAHVEFRPRQYMIENPVKDLEGGGTWGLRKGQFTDDTSMALCLAISLVAQSKFNLYDQLVRYKWWYRNGYMSSTGECFDIGAATSQSLQEFERRQSGFAKQYSVSSDEIDYCSNPELLDRFNVYCSEKEVAGNGALMRLAPVPLFFYLSPKHAVEYSGRSGQITHGDTKAYDACRYYGALIVAALLGYKKNDILDDRFYSKHEIWFSKHPLCTEIREIAEGSYKRKGGYKDGIRGKGYIVAALEAALWAFWSDDNSFEKGALAAVNLGDDTDTTAAIYGQLAGAYYGYNKLPRHWLKHVYAKKFIVNLSKWIAYEGRLWQPSEDISPFIPSSSSQLPMKEMFIDESHSNTHPTQNEDTVPVFNSPPYNEKEQTEKYQKRSKLRSTASEASHRQSEPLNYYPIDVNFEQQSQSDGINTKPLLKQSNSSARSSINETSDILPLAQSIHGPPLRAIRTVDSKEQYVPSSMRIKNQMPSIPDNETSYTTSKPPAHVSNARVPLQGRTADAPLLNNPPLVHSPIIPQSSSTIASKPDQSKLIYRESNSSVSTTQVAPSAEQRSSGSRPADGGINGKSSKEPSTNKKSPTNSKRSRSAGKPPRESKPQSKSQPQSVQYKPTSDPVYNVNYKYANGPAQ